MAYFWSNQIVAVWKAGGGDERNFVLAPLPRVPGGKSANFVKPSQFFSVTSQAKQPKEAAMFIDFITNSIEANEVLLAERGVPISSKVQQALKPKLGRSQAEMFAYLDRVSKDVQPIPPPDPPGHTEIVKNVFNPAGDRPGGVRAARAGQGRRPAASGGQRDPRQGEALASAGRLSGRNSGAAADLPLAAPGRTPGGRR